VYRITQIPALSPGLLPGLAEVLVDAVDDGASVGFLSPFTLAEAESWWAASSERPVALGHVLMWIAQDDAGTTVGTVQAAMGQMPNGRHRAEVKKLLVHRKARGQGVGRLLLETAERGAAAAGATMLMLDTETGSPAEFLYRRAGWVEIGVMPLHSATPDGELKATTFFYKQLPNNS
jgi:GNAT superfamily N-acetyltransferase